MNFSLSPPPTHPVRETLPAASLPSRATLPLHHQLSVSVGLPVEGRVSLSPDSEGECVGVPSATTQRHHPPFLSQCPEEAAVESERFP